MRKAAKRSLNGCDGRLWRLLGKEIWMKTFEGGGECSNQQNDGGSCQFKKEQNILTEGNAER
jgi:hypothetical protein